MTPLPDLEVIAYGPEAVVETRVSSAAEARALRERYPVVWVNVTETSPETAQAVAREFGLHPLAVEDVQNANQRPKLEPYGDHLYMVLRQVYMRPPPDEPAEAPELYSEQFNVFMGRGWVVTFQETPGDVFDGVRDRIRRPEARLRTRGADYLMYRLVDALVDSLFPVMQHLGDRLESIEEQLEEAASSEARSDLQEVKRSLVGLRRVVWPERDAMASLERIQTDLIEPETRTFLRDPLDHLLRVIDFLESYRETAADLRDLYLAEVNARASEVMKVLTLVATLFIPLTFIVGVYGMNFQNMPELGVPWAYPAVLTGMAVLAVGMLFWFRRKGWLGG